MRACDSLMVGGERAALHAKLTPQAVRVSLHGAQKRTHWFGGKAGRDLVLNYEFKFTANLN